jgi:hypothetical protein
VFTKRELAFGCAGIAIGAAIVGTAWATLSWQSQLIPPEYSRLYDVCLADGKSKTACDAAIRIAIAYDAQLRREQARARAEKNKDECVEDHKRNPGKGNFFDCFDPDKVGDLTPPSK